MKKVNKKTKTSKAKLRRTRSPCRKTCDKCGKPSDYYGPDPFDYDINNNHHRVNLCWSCHNDSAMEI